MLSLGGIALPVPTGGFAAPGKVMSQELIGENKTITIYNNTGKPIFPIIEANNTGQNPQNNNAYYDPYDPHGHLNAKNQFVPDDYRLYAGYYEKVAGTKQYFLGIPAAHP